MPARDSPVLPGRCGCLAGPNPLPASFNPTNSLNKIGKDFLQRSYAFLPNPNTTVCLGPCNAPKQNRKSHKAFLMFPVVFLAARTEGPSFLLFCLRVVFFFFSSSTSTSVQSSCASNKGSQRAEEENVLTKLKGWN